MTTVPDGYTPPLDGTTTAADIRATRADLAWARRNLAEATTPQQTAEFTERVAAMEADLEWELADHRYGNP